MRRSLVASVGLVAAVTLPLLGQQWLQPAGDQASSHYSPLSQITPQNVQTLQVAWEWKPEEKNLPQFGTRPGAFQASPIVIGNVMYVSTHVLRCRGARRDHRQATLAIRLQGL